MWRDKDITNVFYNLFSQYALILIFLIMKTLRIMNHDPLLFLSNLKYAIEGNEEIISDIPP